jgi:hypothetical protein
MTATFHPNRAEMTNDRSVRVQKKKARVFSVQAADMEGDHDEPKYSGRNIMLNAYMPRVTTSEMII